MAFIDSNASHVEHRRRIQGPKSGAASDLASSGPLKEEDAAYFSELLGYSMERLAREPELLASEQEYLARQAAEVVSSHRLALVESAKTTRTVGELLAGASGRLDALQAALPRLQAAGEAFQTSAACIEASQRENQLLAGSAMTVRVIVSINVKTTAHRSGCFISHCSLLKLYSNSTSRFVAGHFGGPLADDDVRSQSALR